MRLSEQYHPLKHLKQRPWYLVPILSKSEDVASTVGDTVYINNLEKWIAERPVGSPRWEAVMQHERVHAYRQKQIGAKTYLIRYASDLLFRKKEEQLGWYVQIKILQCRGFKLNVDSIAESLSKYYPPLMNYVEAKSWIYSVLSNRWKPCPNEIPQNLNYLISGC